MMTPAGRDTLKFIGAYITTNGVAPSRAEIGRAFLITPQSAQQSVNRLVREGYVVKTGTGGPWTRGIELTEAGREFLRAAGGGGR